MACAVSAARGRLASKFDPSGCAADVPLQTENAARAIAKRLLSLALVYCQNVEIRMALLKKGSKGKPVEELQTLINKVGIKPELKVDGIFGPLTDKNVRAAQKKLELKVDGKAGDNTMAALKYGKPLPDVNPRFSKSDLTTMKTLNAQLGNMQDRYKKIERESRDFNFAAENLLSVTNELKMMNDGTWKDVIKKFERYFVLVEKAQKAKLSNPAAAAKLAQEIEEEEEELQLLISSILDVRKDYVPAIEKCKKALLASSTEINKLTAEMQKTLNGIPKAVK
ncbi:MAG: peptidoglycan-binding protein [Pseudomonadota bacterium]